MSRCVKTGAKLYLTEYNLLVNADIYQIGISFIAKFAPLDPKQKQESASNATWLYEPTSIDNFDRVDVGVIVASPKELFPCTTVSRAAYLSGAMADRLPSLLYPLEECGWKGRNRNGF